MRTPRRFPGLVAIALLAVSADAPMATELSAPPPPAVGFTFSPKSLDAGMDEDVALHSLLVRLHPDLVRLPVYWDSVAPDRETLDFTEVDGLLKVISGYNAKALRRPVRVILIVGARNIVTPEVHMPSWIDDGVEIDQLLGSEVYHHYLEATFERYAASPLLYAWQVENEPLDSTNDTLGNIALSTQSVAQEIDVLRNLDAVHPVVITTFNSSHVNLDKAALNRFGWIYEAIFGNAVGHPQQALTLGDALGLDLYVVTPSTPLDQVSAETRVAWKAQALRFWSDRAARENKNVWVTEMQGAPWDATAGFTTDDLLASAHAYRGAGPTVVLLWGVEQWLDAPDWMTAGRSVFKILRS
jgi:hypothetical protein